MGWGDGYPAWWDAAPASVRAVLGPEYEAREAVSARLREVRPDATEEQPVVWCRWPTRGHWMAWCREQGADVVEPARIWRAAYGGQEVVRATADVRAERERERGEGWTVPVAQRPCWRVYVQGARLGEETASLCRRAQTAQGPAWVPHGVSASYGPCVSGLAQRQAACMRVTDARWYAGDGRAESGRVGWCQRRCRSRCCPVCLRASASRRAATYLQVGEELSQVEGLTPLFVTLTQRAFPGETLASAIARLRGAWSRLRRDRGSRAQWARVVAGVSGMEATAADPDGVRRWHVHLHLAVWLEGDAVGWRRWLERVWGALAGVDGGESEDPWGRMARRPASPSGGVDVRPATLKELRYTLKYAGKPADMDDEQLCEWAMVTAGMRMHLPMAGLHPSSEVARRYRAGEQWRSAAEMALYGHFQRIDAAKEREEAPLLEVWDPRSEPLDSECLVCPAVDRVETWTTAAGGAAAIVVPEPLQLVRSGRVLRWPGEVAQGGLGDVVETPGDARARERLGAALGDAVQLGADGQWVPLRPHHVRGEHALSGQVLIRAGGDDAWGSDMVLSVACERLTEGLEQGCPEPLVQAVEKMLNADNLRES